MLNLPQIAAAGSPLSGFMRATGVNIGGTNNNLTVSGSTITPTASPYAGYLLKSMNTLGLKQITFPKIWKPANTRCRVDILGASVRANTATGGGADYITLDAAASAVDDTYNGKMIVLKTLAGAGQTRIITDYIGSTKRAYVTGDAWTAQPANLTTFEIFDGVQANVEPGYAFEQIDYTSVPTINVLCSLEKQSGATAAPSMGIPIVTSIEKDWVSQVPIVVEVPSNVYITALNVVGKSRLDLIQALNTSDQGRAILRVTVDGTVVVNDFMTVYRNQIGFDALYEFSLVAANSLLVEVKSTNAASTVEVHMSYSR